MTQTHRQLEATVDETALVGNLIVPCTNALRGMQGGDGAFVRQLDTARRVLEDLCPLIIGIYDRFDQAELARALEADVSDWTRRGLDTPPVFERTGAAYRVPAADGPTFFYGPVCAADGSESRGTFIEAFLAWREEPEECRRVTEMFSLTDIVCQPARVLRATDGIVGGNAIVFSPENIAGRGALKQRNDSLCFFNKFNRIYHGITLPGVHRLFGGADSLFGGERWLSGELSPEDCYRARCVAGYLRQHFARRNPRMDKSLSCGLNWYAGLLEEIKVGCKTALACLEAGVPYGREAFQFTLFEWLLRYPRQLEATQYNDAGSGGFLFEWFYAKDAIGVAGGGRLRISLEAVCDALQALIDAAESLDRLTDDAAYIAGAKALIRHHLPEGAHGERFALPRTYRSLAGALPQTGTLRFDRLEY